MMKRFIVITLLLSILLSGCITNNVSNNPPAILSFTPETFELYPDAYTSITFSIKPHDPDEDHIVCRWYVNDEYLTEGDKLTYTFTKEKTDIIKVVVDDGKYTIDNTWKVNTAIDMPLLIENVENIRSLKFLEDVPFEYISRENLLEKQEENYIEQKEEIYITEKILLALNVWEKGDFYEELLDFYNEGIIGYYNYDEKKVYLIEERNENPIVRKITIAHELTHVLQDQHYNILSMETQMKGDDRLIALTCLLEGDASYVEATYTLGLSIIEIDALYEYYASYEYCDFNNIIADIAFFPYIYGTMFVEEIISKYGIEYLESVYKRPPSSTEQILHLEKYLSNESPILVEAPYHEKLESLEETTLGEGMLSIILEKHIPKNEAKTAAEGWGGDSYGYYESDDAYLFLYATKWDDQNDAIEFYNAYLHSIKNWDIYYNILKDDGNYHMLLESANRYVALTLSGDSVLLAISNSIEIATSYV